MGLRTGTWVTVTIAKDANPAVSSEADLLGVFRSVQVHSPAIDNATLTVKPATKDITGGTAVQAYIFKLATTGDVANTSTTKTGAAMNVFKDICARYVTLLLSATQTTAARTFYIRGIDPI